MTIQIIASGAGGPMFSGGIIIETWSLELEVKVTLTEEKVENQNQKWSNLVTGREQMVVGAVDRLNFG